ncbi:MAG: SurA N-terminal domain-containing protein [Desulfuromonadales bacterium]|nr:SurA N-terminal domain-containing protein [Desulfuromonadales bacterium]
MPQHQFRNRLIITVLFTLLATLATGEVINKVAAVVNDTIITTYQLDQRMAETVALDPGYAGLDEAGRETYKKKVLDLMIEEELIQQRAVELKVRASDEEVNAAIDDVQVQNKLTRLQLIAALEQQGMSFASYRSNMRSQITRYKLIGREVQNKIDVTGQEIRRYYEQHLDEYRNPPYVHLSRIVFFLHEDVTDGEAAALEVLAEQARRRLVMGDSIADLLATYSEAEGGDMGKLRESDLTTVFAEAIVGLQSKEISEIVKTSSGLFLFKMEERNIGTLQPLEKVRPDIEKILMAKSRDEALKKWQEALRANAYIDIRL